MSGPELLILLFLLALWLIFGFLGAYIAEQKKRSGTEGFLLGFLFGPFGCLIEALLPTQHTALPYRQLGGSIGVVIPEMPEDWGKPGFSQPVKKAPMMMSTWTG